MSFYTNNIYNSLKMAGGYLNISPDIIKNIPVPNNMDSELSMRLKDILRGDLNETSLKEIDNLIYRLYKLSYHEVLLVESDFNLSEFEYYNI